MTDTDVEAVSATTLTTQAGISYRQLDHWTRHGWLHPDRRHPGSGHDRRWPVGEVVVATTIRRLLDSGLTIHAAQGIARDLLANGAHDLPGGYRLLDPGRPA